MAKREKIQPTIIPMVSIHPNQITIYDTFHWPDGESRRGGFERLKDKDNYPNLRLSENAQRKLERAVIYLNATSKFKLGTLPNHKKTVKYKVTFITLTLPNDQIHPVQQITNACLNQFFIEAKKKWNLSKYVWKAEFQRNGNLHYHIVANCFAPYWELQIVWNRIIEKLGYLSAYHERTGKDNPHSTEIKNVSKIKRIAKYVAKYMSKGIFSEKSKVSASVIGYTMRKMKDRRSLTDSTKAAIKQHKERFRIWGCSQNLSQLKGVQDINEAELRAETESLLANPKVKRYVGEHAVVIYIDNSELLKFGCTTINNLLNEYLASIGIT
jgi:hypothetical protein